jgi:hypothetical protein
LGVRVGLGVRVNVAVGRITVGEGTAVSDAVGVGVFVGTAVIVGAGGLEVITGDSSASPPVQLVKNNDSMKRIVIPAFFFIGGPYNLLIPVINTSSSG